MWGWFGHEATLRKPSDKGFPPGAAPYDGVPGAFRAPGGDLLTGNVMFFSPGGIQITTLPHFNIYINIFNFSP